MLWLHLLQLSDSAIPIGTTAHSFGLETLVEDGVLTVPGLADFLRDYLAETGTLEAVYCRVAHALQADSAAFLSDWTRLNARLSAIRTAREARTASLTLGRRFVQLAADLIDPALSPGLQRVLTADKANIHHTTGFGLVMGVLAVPVDLAVCAYLQQTLAGLISACQRLLPLGQSGASKLLWSLKPAIIEASARSADRTVEDVTATTMLPDLASMRHPTLMTRLFIS